ncbi:hypothetical protein L218DRAFT_952619 [Marasmius fiardii PR-910]|nr:hypothetical protein L218DRAFT_952619 [Marasmius fiardii PR-910]
MPSETDCVSENEDLFDQLSDEIDYSAIGEMEWDIYETHSQPQMQASPSNLASTPASTNWDSQSFGGVSSSLDSGQNQSLSRALSPASHSITLPPTSSSSYDIDDYGDVNEEFYAELDELERSYSERERADGVSVVESNPDVSREERGKGKKVCKRTLSDSPDTETSKRKRLKENESGSDPKREPGVSASVLEAFEEEMCCPICCEIVVCAHAVNPCGHTLCGCCGASWFIDNRKPTCPMCRCETESHRPMIPNVTIDAVVRKYVNMKILAGLDGKEELEKLKKDFDAREYKWKLQERRLREEFDRRSRIVASASVVQNHVGPLPWWRALNRPGS